MTSLKGAPLHVRRARVGRPWKRLQARVFAEETHCCLCGEWVDQSIVDHNHPRARSVQHIRNIHDAPELVLDRTNVGLAHRECNWRAGQGGGDAGFVRARPSREWI